MKYKKLLNAVVFCACVALTVYLLQHMDSVAEAFIGLQIRFYGLTAHNARAFAINAVNEAGCSLNDTVCVINAINRWVYKSVKYNYTTLHAHFYGFNDVLKNGGVCAQKVMVALIMLHSLGIHGCKVQTEITINDGTNIGHEWFECRINKTYKLICDPTNYENCTKVYIH